MVNILDRAKLLGFNKDPNKYINMDGSETADFLCLCLVKAFLGSNGLHIWLDTAKELIAGGRETHFVEINGLHISGAFDSISEAIKVGVEKGLDMLEERRGDEKM